MGKGDKDDGGKGDKGEKSAVRVMTRVRPFNARELGLCEAEYPNSVVHMEDGHRVNLVDDAGSIRDTFDFHEVFWSIPESQKQFCAEPFADQAAVFDKTGVVAVQAALKGYHTCIFAYGQTGSGKTYTMLGSEDDPGIAPRLVDLLYQEVAKESERKSRTGAFHYSVGLSFMEIYNEKCKDLLVDTGGSSSQAERKNRRRSRKMSLNNTFNSSASGANFLNVSAASLASIGGASSAPRSPRSPRSPGTTSPRPSVSSASPTGGSPSAMPGKKRRGSTAPRSPGAVRQRRGSSAKTGDAPGPTFADDPPDPEYKELRVRKSPVFGVHVQGLTRLDKDSGIATAEDVKRVIRKGMEHRATAETLMNSTSSRSHAVFTLSVVAKNRVTGIQRYSNINLVDLAGSERIKMSGVEGDRLTEATKINLSLSTLRRVIDVLIENSLKKKHEPKMIAPYRDSMLTWVLSESLGGNSKTMMLATISPFIGNMEDTTNTLRYAVKAKSIVNTVRVNEERSSVLVSAMQAEIEVLREQMEENQEDEKQWEVLRDELEDKKDEMEQMQLDTEEQAKLHEVYQAEVDRAERMRAQKLEEHAELLERADDLEEERRHAEEMALEIAEKAAHAAREVEAARLAARRVERERERERAQADDMRRKLAIQKQERELERLQRLQERRRKFSMAFENAFTRKRTSEVINEFQAELARLATSCSEAQEQTREREGERALLSGSNEHLRERERLTSKMCVATDAHNREELATARERLAQLGRQSAVLDEEHSALSASAEKLERRLAAEEDTMRRVAAAFERERQRLDDDVARATSEQEAKEALLESLRVHSGLLARESATVKSESHQMRQAHDVMVASADARAAEARRLSAANEALRAELELASGEIRLVRDAAQVLEKQLRVDTDVARRLREEHRDLKDIVTHKFFPKSGSSAPRTLSPGPAPLPGCAGSRTTSPVREREWVGEGLHYPSRTHSPPQPPRTRSPPPPERTKSPGPLPRQAHTMAYASPRQMSGRSRTPTSPQGAVRRGLSSVSPLRAPLTAQHTPPKALVGKTR